MMMMMIYIYIYTNQEGLQEKYPTVVEDDSKAPFSIATTPNGRGGRYSFLWIEPLTIYPYLKC